MNLPEKLFPKVAVFVARRIGQDSFRGLPLTIIILLGILLLFTFLGIIEDIITSDPIVQIDKYIAFFLLDHRTEYLTQFFLSITLGGKGVVASVFGVLFSLYLLLRKDSLYIIPLIATLSGAGLSTSIIKTLVHRDRPGTDIAYYIEKTLSFPSGHAAISVAFYGFLAYYFIRKAITWNKKVGIFFIALFVISLIGLSRLYLGVHYFSDVLGGYVIGMLWLLIGITITEIIRFRFKKVSK